MYTGDEIRTLCRHRLTCDVVARLALGVLMLSICVLCLTVSRPVHADDNAQLLLTEVMVNPREVPDAEGEWIEITNVGAATIDLAGWAFVAGEQRSEIVQEYLVAPGDYVVIAAQMDPKVNGGVPADLHLATLRLRNERDRLSLLSSQGDEVDSLAWGADTGIIAPEGASLERQGTSRSDSWGPAHSRWTGSAGDRGSPGAPYSPPPVPTDTPTSTPSPPALTETPTATPSPPNPTAVPPTQTETTVPTATSTPHPSEPAHILISEVMANPAAVEDSAGEWFEIYNADSSAVNLYGWQLADLDTDHHIIASDLWIETGAYLVLGRNGDASANGGATVDYVYDHMDLANETDELLLFAPWGEEVDRLNWGEGTALRIPKGASLERTDFGGAAAWTPASRPWTGSAGDLGSPGAPYVPAPPTATPTHTPTSVPPPTATPLPPDAGTLPEFWPVSDSVSPLVIDEVFPDGSDEEFIILVNVGDASVDAGGWYIGDAETPDDKEGMYVLPAGTVIHPGQLYAIARNATVFSGRWGYAPNAEIEDSEPTVPTLERVSHLASGSFALNNGGDEVLLLNSRTELADAVAWGDGQYHAVRLEGSLSLRDHFSLQRAPGYRFQPYSDVRYRFLTAPPQPALIRSLPQAANRDHPALGDGRIAAWGTLGAHSNFSPSGQAPPHFLASVAAAAGLDFVAIADEGVVHTQEQVKASTNIIALPAWRWRTADGSEAIIYGDNYADLRNWSDLRTYLDAHATAAQALVAEPPSIRQFAAVAGDHVSGQGPSDLLHSWYSLARPGIPAGNAVPPWDGVGSNAPRYTGLAVDRLEASGVLEALAARRGWLTSSPGQWITLRTQDSIWMGQEIAVADPVTLVLQFGDRSGESAGLTLWLDGSIVGRLDHCDNGQTWTVTIPAAEGGFVYAVATEQDGDFAVSAPLLVRRKPDGQKDPTVVSPDVPQVGDGSGAHEPDSSTSANAEIAAKVEQGYEPGPPGSLADAKLRGLGTLVEFRARVVAPPGLFNSAIYVSEPTDASSDVGGLGMQVYLPNGEFEGMEEGDWVLVRGRLHSFRGELETVAENPGQVWRFDSGPPLRPLPIRAYEVGEPLEGRLVTFTGEVARWQGDSIYLCDPTYPEIEVRVTVRSSLDWRRPYVNIGERWRATGIVSQFAKEHPWNGGYRVLVRYPTDIVRLEDP